MHTQRLKWLLWILAAAPVADLAVLTAWGRLGPNPQEALLRATGMWTLVLLLTTLGVTPCRHLLRWPQLVAVRRMLGLWTFAYALLHLFVFWAFEHDFDFLALLTDSTKRPFVTVGLASFVLLLPLALTSHRAAVSALGAHWKTLHRLIYLIAILACIHFFLHRAGKNNFADPLWATAATAVLLAARIHKQR